MFKESIREIDYMAGLAGNNSSIEVMQDMIVFNYTSFNHQIEVYF